MGPVSRIGRVILTEARKVGAEQIGIAFRGMPIAGPWKFTALSSEGRVSDPAMPRDEDVLWKPVSRFVQEAGSEEPVEAFAGWEEMLRQFFPEDQDDAAALFGLEGGPVSLHGMRVALRLGQDWRLLLALPVYIAPSVARHFLFLGRVPYWTRTETTSTLRVKLDHVPYCFPLSFTPGADFTRLAITLTYG